MANDDFLPLFKNERAWLDEQEIMQQFNDYCYVFVRDTCWFRYKSFG